MRKIRLEKEFVTKMYFYQFQAERSIDKVLGNPWSDFLAYYGPAKTRAIQDIIEIFKARLRERGINSLDFQRKEIENNYPELGTFRHLFGKSMGRLKKSWAFPARELCYMGTSLRSVLELLRLPVKPELSLLASLRVDLCCCRSIIEIRCRGLAVLDCGARIEHLYQSDWIAPVSLEDVLMEKPLEPIHRKTA